MIISKLRESLTSDKGRRIEADIEFEDCGREPQTVWFESSNAALPLDPNLFLIGALPIASFRCERRIKIDAPVSPLLLEKLNDVMAWWKAWGFTRSRTVIEAEAADWRNDLSDANSLGFLSGGIDSLHMIYSNVARFQKGHPHRLTHGAIVYGYSRLPSEGMQALLTPAVQRIAHDTGIQLLTLNTNLRLIEGDLLFWRNQFHGAFLGAAGHAALGGRGVARIASTFDVPNMSPWASHPLIDSNYSTERVSFLHEGVASSRLDKVMFLVDHPSALENAQVCSNWVEGYLNCGRCEKCVRTKLELLVAGVEIPQSFAEKDLSPRDLMPIENRYQASCYRELVEPLRDRGEKALSQAVARRLAGWPVKLKLRQRARLAKKVFTT